MKKIDWESKHKDKLRERRSEFQTTSNIKIERFYTSQDISKNIDEKNSLPGEFPFTRGVQPTMYRGRFWTMRQYAGFGSAKETNEITIKADNTGVYLAIPLKSSTLSASN